MPLLLLHLAFLLQDIWAVSFSALGQEGAGIRAHHMILSKCKEPKKKGYGETWDCRHHAMCNDQSKIMFAWAKHAQPTKLPQDVGFTLQQDDYLVLQVSWRCAAELEKTSYCCRCTTPSPSLPTTAGWP